MPPSVEVEVDGRRLALSNLDKVLYPETGFTKADIISYYRSIAPVLLPHLQGRVPTLVRAPNGYGGQTFFEKRCPPGHPKWVRTATIGGDGKGGMGRRNDAFTGCLVDDLPTLIWTANLAALELHTHQARASDQLCPTAVVLDLDPGDRATIVDCCRVALELRETLARLDLQAVVKTSGSKGLHLSIPLNTEGVTADDTKRFALALGQLLESRDPQRVTVDMAKERRVGRVFVDWSQNDRHKTTVCAYSLRIRPRPWVSTPLSWDEVETVHEAEDVDALVFEAPLTLARVEQFGDLYEPNLTIGQELPAL
jgi:bifunctional non-homologous end joining protein LigD